MYQVSTKRVSVTLTEYYLARNQQLLDKGVYFNRAELFRDVLEKLFRERGLGIIQLNISHT